MLHRGELEECKYPGESGIFRLLIIVAVVQVLVSCDQL